MGGELLSQLKSNGYAIVEPLLFPEECNELKQAAYELSQKLLEEGKDKMIFNTKDEVQLKEDYFLQSNDKIRAFVESDALDEAGNIKVDPKFSLNKIGHALHLLHPLFRCYTYCSRVKTACRLLGLAEPAVVQSMVVFKNPNVSSEVQPHQDGSYLFAEPIPAIGFWIALEDATVENGCLWIASGSHLSGIHRRLTRNHNKDSPEKLIYDKPNPSYPASSFRPVPVKKGSCIILHGNVVHKSGINKTDQARPAYTFHVVEQKNNNYSPDNWLQEGPEAPFENMYQVQQTVFDEKSEELHEEIVHLSDEFPSVVLYSLNP